MIAIVLLCGLATLANCGVIHHGDEQHGGHATSYQHVKIENYHAVPVFVKKEHSELLHHPVSAGHVDHGVKIHHGDGHHDPGYAVQSGDHHAAQHNVGHLLAGHEEQSQHEGLSAYAGHEGIALGHDAGVEVASGHEGQEGHEAAAVQGYEGQHGYEGLEAQQGYEGHAGYAAYEAQAQGHQGAYEGNVLHGHGTYESAGHGGHY